MKNEFDGSIMFAKWLLFKAGKLEELNELLDAGKYDEAEKLLNEATKQIFNV